MNGKLIVIDGIDGSGKTTQIELLSKYLNEKNIPFEVISFPRYGESIFADLITRYLEGELGENVNPYLIALAYANDRLLVKPLIEAWLNEGKIVLANRYVSASKAHLGANLVENERENFMEWIDEMEFKTNNMPKSDLTIFLNVDPKKGQENVSAKHKLDLHEKDLSHEEKAAKIYLEIAESEENWKIIECMEGKNLKSKESINKLLVEILGNILLS